ncbi:MAG TPA: hypothetical protein VNY34_03325 [Solirubrobacteraceae bacterium]|jgi:hypothetical protein|nr:hypothetical protein [Solirubrobacteraceae bacterium]
MSEHPRPRTEAELIELVRSSDLRAPDSLHSRIESMVAEHGRRRRSSLGGALTAVGAPLGRRLVAAGALVAVVVAVLAVVLGGAGHASLSLRQASALTLGPATTRAPAESTRNGAELVASVQGVHFPYWEEHFGWRSTGQRTERVAGRTVTTVFYANGRGQRIGYAIVAGTPAPSMQGGNVQWRHGTSYRLLHANGAEVVTWLRDGRLCVLSGRGVDRATLVRLASWGQPGSVA